MQFVNHFSCMSCRLQDLLVIPCTVEIGNLQGKRVFPLADVFCLTISALDNNECESSIYCDVTTTGQPEEVEYDSAAPVPAAPVLAPDALPTPVQNTNLVRLASATWHLSIGVWLIIKLILNRYKQLLPTNFVLSSLCSFHWIHPLLPSFITNDKRMLNKGTYINKYC